MPVVILTEDRYYTGLFLFDRFLVSRTSQILPNPMVNSPRSFAPSPPIGLDSAATELKVLFEEIRPLDGPRSSLKGGDSGLSSLPLMPLTEGLTPAPQAMEGRIQGLSPRLRSIIGGVFSVGAIVLTMVVGGLSGAMVAQRFPQLSEGKLSGPSAAVTAPPVLEQVFQVFTHQRPRLSAQVYHWFNRPSSLDPATLSQWQPGELEAEIDRLLAASQTLEAEVAQLEQQLEQQIEQPLGGQLGLQAEERGLSQRLLALRQSVDSPSVASLPLQMTLPADLLFEDGKTSLKPEAQDLLDNLENSLRSELNVPQGTRLNLTIATHTDEVGNASQNLDLSFQRSRSLQIYLSQRLNSPALSWIPVGYGATRPLADNSTESNRQRNRRVEITLDW